MTHKSRIAVKHVNVMDRVEEHRHPMAAKPMPALVRRIDPPTRRFDWPEWDKSTLGDLIASGLLGQ